MNSEKVKQIVALNNDYDEKEYYANHIKKIVSNSKFAVGTEGSYIVQRLNKVLNYDDIKEISDLIIKKCDIRLSEIRTKIDQIK